MAIEIERKYLVLNDAYKQQAKHSVRIVQGYLCRVKERTVRVRIKADEGYITVKGIGSESGASRYEWEKKISLAEAKELLQICEPGIIDKTRFFVDYKGHTYEVDEFYGDNEGLVVAEVELDSEQQQVYRPAWIATEVTGDSRYYNSALMQHPYQSWSEPG